MLMADNHDFAPGARQMIFVVDDEPMLLDLAEMILAPEGFEVRTFRDPRQALAVYAAAKRLPDVLVTDYAMEGMNGLDLIRKCRQLHPAQKTVLVSGTVDEGVYADSEIKPDTFVPKPYNPERLIAVVQALAVPSGRNENSNSL